MRHPRGLRVGFLLFDDVELLDFAGPLQVLSSAQYVDHSIIDSIDTISNKTTIKVSKTTIEIKVDHVIHEGLGYDLLVIPGGFGTRALIKDESFLILIKSIINRSEMIATVCTGSLVPAKLGFLSGLKSTTHYAALDLLETTEPKAIVDRSKRYHDNGKFIIAEGVSAGIDMSFYLLKKLWGRKLSDQVRKYIEYYPEKA